MTDKNRDRHEKADAKIKVIEEEHVAVKATVSENQDSQNQSKENLKRLEEKITALAQTEAQSQRLPTQDGRKIKCDKCDDIFSDKEQLIKHNKAKHRRTIVCRICEQQFQENFKIEEHLINEHKKSKGYKCECSFLLKW